ncbi:hypothetical protein AVEN_218700-1 [Araneus ventricosus]|uniref:Uncharacterized protein n=1 Tax=Araneus ventricosus TaxID=182803 RepID=A0A4Y2B6M8_ARAVE|nr:hypothetical protein AVEN_218700-1 [Araneus ventricosus]
MGLTTCNGFFYSIRNMLYVPRDVVAIRKIHLFRQKLINRSAHTLSIKGKSSRTPPYKTIISGSRASLPQDRTQTGPHRGDPAPLAELAKLRPPYVAHFSSLL